MQFDLFSFFQSALAMELFSRIIVRGNLMEPSITPLALNLWNLAQRHNFVDSKLEVSIYSVSFHFSIFLITNTLLSTFRQEPWSIWNVRVFSLVEIFTQNYWGNSKINSVSLVLFILNIYEWLLLLYLCIILNNVNNSYMLFKKMYIFILCN